MLGGEKEKRPSFPVIPDRMPSRPGFAKPLGAYTKAADGTSAGSVFQYPLDAFFGAFGAVGDSEASQIAQSLTMP
jgi:hypothetical protein